MPDKLLIHLGLNALARAKQLNYFADGHRGAAIIAAHYLCENNNLNEYSRSRIRELIETNWGKIDLCKDFPKEKAYPQEISRIGIALNKGADTLRQVGHNAIFAMLAIKALRAIPSLATKQRIDGICAMIDSFTPWNDIQPDPEVKPPPFADSAAASEFILREALATVDLFKGFGQGFAGHMLTFGQALVELAVMGDEAWAESCRSAFCKYITFTRRGPGSDSPRQPDHKFSKLRPLDRDYWQKRAELPVGIGHFLKYPYSYYELLRYAAASDLESAFNDKAYLLF